MTEEEREAWTRKQLAEAPPIPKCAAEVLASLLTNREKPSR